MLFRSRQRGLCGYLEFTETLTDNGNYYAECLYPAFNGNWYLFYENVPFSIDFSVEGDNFSPALLVLVGECDELRCIRSSNNHQNCYDQTNSFTAQLHTCNNVVLGCLVRSTLVAPTLLAQQFPFNNGVMFFSRTCSFCWRC